MNSSTLNSAIVYTGYAIALGLVILAGFFKVLDATTAIASFTLVLGHLLGLQVIPPQIARQLSVVQPVAVVPSQTVDTTQANGLQIK